MKTPLLLLALMVVGLQAADKSSYVDNDLLYEKAMNMLEQQIQLLRNFVNEINHVEGLKSTGHVWRGLSNVFTDLSGMFGGGNGHHYQLESYGMDPPKVNTTELTRKAQIRMEQIRQDIMETNSRISKIINDAFGSQQSHGSASKDESVEKHGKNKQQIARDDVNVEQAQANNNYKAIESSSSKPTDKDETSFPVAEGFIGFELPIRGSISLDVLKEQLYQEEFDMVSGMSPRELGKILKPLIAKGKINANVGQCHISKLLDDETH